MPYTWTFFGSYEPVGHSPAGVDLPRYQKLPLYK